MRKYLALAVSAALLALVSGCGADEEPEPDSAAPDVTSEAPADEPTSDEPAEDETSGEAGGGAGTVLTATVGSEADPDAFEIMLMDESGEAVTELAAGDYTIEVVDYAMIHNFHLTGGSVEESTAVDEVTEVTWEVTLEAGDYSFRCDPHPAMSGGFTVA